MTSLVLATVVGLLANAFFLRVLVAFWRETRQMRCGVAYLETAAPNRRLASEQPMTETRVPSESVAVPERHWHRAALVVFVFLVTIARRVH